MSTNGYDLSQNPMNFSELTHIQKELEKVYVSKPGVGGKKDVSKIIVRLEGIKDIDDIVVRLEKGGVVFKKKSLFSCFNKADGIDIQSAKKLKDIFANINVINLLNASQTELNGIRELAELTDSIVSKTLEYHRKQNPSSSGKVIYRDLIDLQDQVSEALKSIEEVNKKNKAADQIWDALSFGTTIDIKSLIAKYPTLVNITDSYGSTILHEALKRKRLDIVDALLESEDIDVTCTDNLGNTPLHLVAVTGLTVCVDKLLEKGADINKVNNKGLRPIHIATERWDTTTTKFLIEKGANVNAINFHGKTALHTACENSFPVLDCVVSQKTDINAQDYEGNTPLFYEVDRVKKTFSNIMWYEHAIKKSAQEISRLEKIVYEAGDRGFEGMLERHRSKHAEYILKLSELYDLLKNVTEHLAVLFENDADPDIKNNSGVTPLAALLDCDFQFLRNPKLTKLFSNTVKSLIDNGADINTKSQTSSETLLKKLSFYTVSEEDPPLQDYCEDLVSVILETIGYNETTINVFRKFHIDIANLQNDSELNTPLHVAVISGNLSLIYQVIEKIDPISSSINAKNYNGNTPLLIITKHLAESIDNLVNYTENYHALSERMLQLNGNVEAGEELRRLSEKLEENIVLINNVKSEVINFFKVIQTLLEKDADPTIGNKYNASPFSVLLNSNFQLIDDPKIKRLFYDVMDAFVNRGVDINTRSIIDGRTLPIKLAEVRDMKNLYRCMTMYKNVDPYLQDYYGNSTISILMNQNYSKMIKFFEDMNIDIAKIKPDNIGNTPLHIAALKGNKELTEYLINKGQSPYEKNIYTVTPFNYAIELYIENRNDHTVFAIFDKYIEKEPLKSAIINSRTIEDINESIIRAVSSSIKDGVNPLEVVLAINVPFIQRKIVITIGQEMFEYWLLQLPKDAAASLIESLKYDLDGSHLDHKVSVIPEKPNGYQMDDLMNIFDELTNDPNNPQRKNELEEKFRGYLLDSDKNRSLKEISDSLRSFIKDCKDRKHITGIVQGGEEVFWGTIEKAVTNTIKELKEAGTYEKKARLLAEYVGIIGYCATRLDLEFERLYYLNSGVVRSFSDDIYFQLSERRARVVESLAPRAGQSVHYIQGILSKLTAYNIPIRASHDPFAQKLKVPYIEVSFVSKYFNGLIEHVKNYLNSDKNSQEIFFKWAEEQGRGERGSLQPWQKAQECLEDIKNKRAFSDPKLANDLSDIMELFGYEFNDLDDKQVCSKILETYFNPEYLTREDFGKIMKFGDAAFEKITDPYLRQAIEESDTKGNLNQFITKSHALSSKQSEEKKKIMEKYIGIRFPDMVKKVKYEDVEFLLQKLGVLKIAEDAPPWLIS